jgi:hypothetical protein
VSGAIGIEFAALVTFPKKTTARLTTAQKDFMSALPPEDTGSLPANELNNYKNLYERS